MNEQKSHPEGWLLVNKLFLKDEEEEQTFIKGLISPREFVVWFDFE